MATHSLLCKYELLNAHYTGTRPHLGPEVKCVQCDGCGRVITFAVFHSDYGGGVDVCNFCRVAAERNKNGYLTCIEHKRRLCFAKHPLCFVGRAPLPEGYEVDVDEIEVENNFDLLKQRFAKSVDVIVNRRSGRPEKRARDSHIRNGDNARPQACASESTVKDGNEEDGGEDEPRVKRSGLRPRRSSTQTMAKTECGDKGVKKTPRPLRLQPPVAQPQSSPSSSLQQTEPKTAGSVLSAAAPLLNDGVQREDETTSTNCSQNPTVDENKCVWRTKLESIVKGPVARFFSHIEPHTKSIEERPVSVVRQSLCVFDQDNMKELTVAPNTSCRVSRGFVGVTSCNTVLCVRIVPTMPDAGLWLSVLCEEECCTRLEIWHCPLDISAHSLSPFNFGNGASPQRMYCVHMGHNMAESMDWLPIPLHRKNNNTLGLCTFIRGCYLISTVLPRVEPAKHPLASVSPSDDTDGGGGAYLAAEVCGATLLKHKLQPVEVRWGSNGTSINETFLFTIARCTSVVVLRPTDDTRSGRLTLQAVHYIEAKGVAAPPSFLRSPPLAIGAARGGHAMLVVAHGTSVACYQAPEFGTKLFVAMEDVVCSLQLHERHVVAGLESGMVVDINTGKTMTKLESPPLLIDRVVGACPDDETWFVSDASGMCTQLHRHLPREELVKQSDFLLCRVQRGLGQRPSLLMRGSGVNTSLPTTSNSVAQFVQHPLQHLMNVRCPQVVVFTDGTWILAP